MFFIFLIIFFLCFSFSSSIKRRRSCFCNNLSSILYGYNDSEKDKTGENNNNNYLFPTKNEFENYKKKTEDINT